MNTNEHKSEIRDCVTLSSVLQKLRAGGVQETMQNLKHRVTTKSSLRDVQTFFGPGGIQRQIMCWHVRDEDQQRILEDYGVD